MRKLQTRPEIEAIMRGGNAYWGYRMKDGEVEAQVFDGYRPDGWADSPADCVKLPAHKGDPPKAEPIPNAPVGDVPTVEFSVLGKDELEDMARAKGVEIDRRRKLETLQKEVAALYE